MHTLFLLLLFLLNYPVGPSEKPNRRIVFSIYYVEVLRAEDTSEER
jgi:hypothetical protein